jgi:tartrate dehydrogenase/decarboxylase/D-malate dehydrogenase
MKNRRIAVIPGDGIGKEVIPEGLRVMDAALGKYGITMEFRQPAWRRSEIGASRMDLPG